MKRSSILKLQTENGLLEGHGQCASYLEDQVASLLLHPAPLHQGARDCLLEEVLEVFSEQDNVKFMAIPDEEEVKEVLNNVQMESLPYYIMSADQL